MSLISWLPDIWKEKLRRRAGVFTERARLENLVHCGFKPRQIIDAGAYKGDWTVLARSVFPDAYFLLIEPQPSCAEKLLTEYNQDHHTQVCTQALSHHQGTTHFLLQNSNSRIVPTDRRRENTIEVPVNTLANIAASYSFLAADFIKLDLQGNELSALNGAGALLGNTEVFQIEASWIPIGSDFLVLNLINLMNDHGYRVYDVFGFNHRPLDGALWQSDFFFVHKSSVLLSRNDYK